MPRVAYMGAKDGSEEDEKAAIAIDSLRWRFLNRH